MADLKFKYLNEANIADNFTDFSYVFIEDAGEIKRIHKDVIDGNVKSVNGIKPDENGNIEIEISEIELPEINYPVTSVNGMTGDVEIEIPEQKNITVNGIAPNESGNIQIEIPEQKNITVNGVAPDESGNIQIEIGSGSVSSWNDLVDKPFYEESGNIIEWDGQTSLGERFNIFGDGTDEFVKVSNLTFSYEELIGSKVISNISDSFIITESNASRIIRQGTNAIMFGELMLITYDTTFTFDDMEGELFSCPSPGIYMNYTLAQDREYISQFIYNFTPLKTLDEKFIPNTIAKKTDIANHWQDLGYDYSLVAKWDGTINNRECYSATNPDTEVTFNFYKISDTFFTPTQLLNGVMIISGVEDINEISGEEVLPAKVQITQDMFAFATDGYTVVAAISAMPLIISITDTFATENNINISEGTYALLAEAEIINQIFGAIGIGIELKNNIFLTELKVVNEIKQIPEDFLPNTVVSTEDFALKKGALLYSEEITTEANVDFNAEEWMFGADLNIGFKFEDNKTYIIEIDNVASLQQLKNGHFNGRLIKYLGNGYGLVYTYLYDFIQQGDFDESSLSSYLFNNVGLSGLIDTQEEFFITDVSGRAGIITKLPKTFTLKIYEDGNNEAFSSYLIPESIRKVEKLFTPGTVIEYDPYKKYDESIDTIITMDDVFIPCRLIKISENSYTLDELIGQYFCFDLKNILQSSPLGGSFLGKFADVDFCFSSSRINKNNFTTGTDNSCFSLFDTLIFVTEDSITISQLNNVTLSKGVWMIEWSMFSHNKARIKIGFSDVLSDFAIPETCARTDRLYWDLVKDKPFYDEISSEQVTIDFNGSYEDKSSIVFNTVDFGDLTMIKISDDTPEKEQLKLHDLSRRISSDSFATASMNYFIDFINYPFFNSGKGYIVKNWDIPVFIVMEAFSALDKEGVSQEFTPGIWIGYKSENDYICEINYAKEIITHKINEKFIPDTVVKISDLPVLDYIADCTGETVTVAEFNALLAALRAAGLMATE